MPAYVHPAPSGPSSAAHQANLRLNSRNSAQSSTTPPAEPGIFALPTTIHVQAFEGDFNAGGDLHTRPHGVYQPARKVGPNPLGETHVHTHKTRRSGIASIIGWVFGLSAIATFAASPSIGVGILVLICVGVWAVHHPRVSKKLAGGAGKSIRKGTRFAASGTAAAARLAGKGTKRLVPALTLTRGGDAK